MRTWRLLVLTAVVLGLAAYIYFVERHQPTTAEAKEQAEKVLGKLDRDAVTGLEITGPNGAVKMTKADDVWRLTEPIEAPAEESTVNSLLSALTGLKIERSLAAGEVQPDQYKLDAPEYTVAIVTKDGARRELKVGAKAALGSNRAVSIGDGRVLLCAGWFTSDLDKDVDGWRSHKVVDVFSDQVASLEVVRPTGRLRAVRDGRQWTLLDPVNDLADRDHIRDTISDLNSLKVQEFLDAKADLDALGLDRPRYRVTLVKSEGKGAVELAFGKTEEKDGKTRVACRRDGKELFWVDDKAEVRLGKAQVLWRSKKVYPVDSWNVEKATFAAADAAVEVERKEGVWGLAGGGEANSNEILQRLSKLGQLEADGYDLVVPGGAERGHITVTMAAEPDGGKTTDAKAKGATITYTFYPPAVAGGKTVVQVSARDTVMSVDSHAVDALLGELDALNAPTPTPAPTATPKPES